MYLLFLLLAVAIFVGIVSLPNYSSSIENKLGWFFQGFFGALVIGGLISIMFSFIISGAIVEKGGKFTHSSTNKLVKTDNDSTYAFQIKGKLSFVYFLAKEPNTFKESLFDLKILPLTDGETVPYVVTNVYESDTHWSFYDMEKRRYVIHINQDQIKIIYDTEVKEAVEK